jgi:hypothetical protein
MERRSILQAFAAMPFMGMFKVKKVATIEDVAARFSEAFDSTPHGNLEMYDIRRTGNLPWEEVSRAENCFRHKSFAF